MGETSYNKAWERLSDAQRKDFDDRLAAWKVAAPQIVENFEREHFLPAAEMKELMEFIIGEGIPVGDEKQVEKIRDKLRDLQLKGGEIEVSPKWIGFAYPKDKYRNSLLKGYEYLFGKKRIDEFFKDIWDNWDNKKSLNKVKKEYSEFLDCTISLFLQWVTWDNKRNNPFSFMRAKTCQEVRDALGLDEENYAHNVFLFFVKVTKLKDRGSQLFFRPTFCDAYLGENFRPTPVNFVAHGLTWPLGEKYSEKEHPTKGRPEAVVRSEHIVLGKIEKVLLLEK
jgi:hypothetical protein